MDCTIRVAKTKALISFAVTAKLICAFVFAYAKSRFSHNEAHLLVSVLYVENARSNLSIHWAHMPLCWFCHARLLLVCHVNQYIVVSITPPIVILLVL